MEQGSALLHPWAPRHRPDWAARGLIAWPRGGLWWRLVLRLECPSAWRSLGPAVARARLVLRWWADRAELRVEGTPVHRGDLFDTACRWPLPERWWGGEPLDLELRLRSPLHDDGALIHSRVELEPIDPADPHQLLAPTVAALEGLRMERGLAPAPPAGTLHLLGHAHLDLAWLWPVADTWQAAERTFASALDLMERFADLHFGHSTPALYAWLERHRPALYARVRKAMRAGRWEPLNGPWVESDCVLVGTASLLRQFHLGQCHSRRAFPEWEHALAWLPDSFGFSAGLPAVAAATGVRWFCTHKLAWNATNPFPHRLFRWRSRCGAEVLALITAPIGTDGDPLAIEGYRLDWQRSSGVADALWLPGVGDHGGGPTAEMLEQLALWSGQPAAAPQRHGTLRGYLGGLEPLVPGLPVWRDELYLELHRGCATSRPDQKRHNRTLERLLREAELARALMLACGASAAGGEDPEEAVEWEPLLFQQFHDILPGTSIPEVFEQAEPQWRAARRRARSQRDRALRALLAPPRSAAARGGVPGPAAGTAPPVTGMPWVVMQLQPLIPEPRTVRLPCGTWTLPGEGRTPQGAPLPGQRLIGQSAPGGGQWLQIPAIAGIGALELRWEPATSPGPPAAAAAGRSPHAAGETTDQAVPIRNPVQLERLPEPGPERWLLGNGRVSVVVGPHGVEQIRGADGRPRLAGHLAWCRWRDRGEFWDAWDLAADYRSHPLAWEWEGGVEWLERGPLCGRFLRRGRCGASPVRLEGRLLAGAPCLELLFSVDWRQRHELLRLEVPLARVARRWAADTPAGVLERPAEPRTPRERARWEVAAVSWLASVEEDGGGLAVLLDGPQGVDAAPDRLGVSLLRAPTWPDPGADNGWQRLRLALMPCAAGWRPDGVAGQARRWREPLWCRPLGSAPGALRAAAFSAFAPLAPDLELVALRPAADGSSQVVVAVQNGGPCRRRLEPGFSWQVVARLNGLDEPLVEEGEAMGGGAGRCGAPDPLELGPWQLGFWLLAWGAGAAEPQSS